MEREEVGSVVKGILLAPSFDMMGRFYRAQLPSESTQLQTQKFSIKRALERKQK